MAMQPIDRDTDYLLPPSVQEWLPKSHLARYVVDERPLSASTKLRLKEFFREFTS
jgi:hypothetical protein